MSYVRDVTAFDIYQGLVLHCCVIHRLSWATGTILKEASTPNLRSLGFEGGAIGCTVVYVEDGCIGPL